MENETLKNDSAFEKAQFPDKGQEKTASALSYGQKAVGLLFNPSNDDAVGYAKQGFANIIDQMNELRIGTGSQEQKRLASIAITEIQAAQMWAVKAITWKD